MCAGTVVEPPGDTSAAIESVTSRSRSVAFRLSLPLSALTRTLARIGIVLRRSTTRCTWPSDLKSSARSTVTFIGKPARGAFETDPETRRNDKPALAGCEAGEQRWRKSGPCARAGARADRLSPGRPQDLHKAKRPVRLWNGPLCSQSDRERG